MYYYLFYLNNCCSWRNDWAVFSLKQVRVLLIHPIFPFDGVIFEQFLLWSFNQDGYLKELRRALPADCDSWPTILNKPLFYWVPGVTAMARRAWEGGGAASIQISMGTPDYFNYKSCARTMENHGNPLDPFPSYCNITSIQWLLPIIHAHCRVVQTWNILETVYLNWYMYISIVADSWLQTSVKQAAEWQCYLVIDSLSPCLALMIAYRHLCPLASKHSAMNWAKCDGQAGQSIHVHTCTYIQCVCSSAWKYNTQYT